MAEKINISEYNYQYEDDKVSISNIDRDNIDRDSQIPKPPRKMEKWKKIAIFSIILLLISNSFWISQMNQKVEGTSYYELVRINSLTADYYQSLRENVGPQSPQWSIYSDSGQKDVEFCAELAKHDAGKIYWPEWDRPYYEFTNTHAYNDAYNKMFQILTIIGIKPSNSPAIIIEKTLIFINQKISYCPDIINKYFSPIETLSCGTGDCDDYSILFACILEICGIDTAVSFYTNSYNKGHALVLVHLNDIGDHGVYHYDDLTSLGLSAGRWLMIDPQFLINEQNDSSWMEQWKIKVAAEV
ncbi:MAG: hypothetical protein A4E32_01382 [Methanomassiliicoccales archaeon PtaU1.Bin124]|nr:MAG: hypothetical protein A4E32_01382 [Methanomassiliicoccales archaeon PtaU1.Bin124]